MKLKIIGVWNITYRRVDKQDEKEEKKEALKWNWREKKNCQKCEMGSEGI